MSDKSKIVAVQECVFTPVMANFQSGLPKDSAEMEVYVATGNGKHNRNMSQLIATSDEGTHSGPITSNTHGEDYLAIRNKATNKIRLVQVNQCFLKSEHITVHNAVDAVQPSDQDPTIQRHFSTIFGGKNALRAQDRTARMRVNIDVIKDQLNQSLAVSKECTKSEKTDEAPLPNETDTIEPPKNYDATKIEQLYDVEAILTKELLHELEEVAEHVLETKPEDLPIDSMFLMDKFRSLQTSELLDKATILLNTKVIIFLDALMNLMKGFRMRKPFAKITLSNICENVEIYIRRHFRDPRSSSFSMSQYTKRKAVCHILVLAILVSHNHEISTDVMVSELKIKKEELFDFARYLNLKTSMKGNFLGLKLSKGKEHDSSLKIRRLRNKN